MTRLARVGGGVMLAVVALVSMLVGSTITVLRTSWGSELAKRFALRRLNAAIAGRMEVDTFRFGGDHVALTQVELHGPDGAVVARARRIAVTFSPLALLWGRVLIARADVIAPSLFLREDDGDLNLTRALAPARGRASPTSRRPSAAGGPGSLVIHVADLRVDSGLVELVRAGANGLSGGPAITRAGSISIRAHGCYDAAPRTFDARVRLDAALEEPARTPISLRLEGRGMGERRIASLEARVGGAELEAALRTETAGRATLRVERGHLTPALVRAFLPRIPLSVPLDLTARLDRTAPLVNGAVTLGGPAGQLVARGTIDTASRRAREISIEVRRLDLGKLLDGFPQSALSLTAEGEGGGASLTTLTGQLTVTMPAGRLDGGPLGPVALRVSADRGRYELSDLRLRLPGAVMRGHGVLGPSGVDIQLVVDAHDLARASIALSTFRAVHAPPFAGRGRLELAVSGTLATPEVRARAVIPRLAIAADSIDALRLEAHVPNAHEPEIASLNLRAVAAGIGGRMLRDINVRARSTPRRLSLDARAAGKVPVGLSLAGAWNRRRDSLRLDELGLRYPGASWRLHAPARLSWRAQRLAIAGLDLRSGDQRIRVDAEKRGIRLRGRVALERLDLGALPRPPALALLPLAGRLDLSAAVDGSVESPEIRASVDLRGGRVGRWRDLGLRLEGRYGGGRAKGEIDAQGLGTSLHARFDLPTEWPVRQRSAPLDLALAIPRTDLSILSRAAGSPVRVAGHAELSVELHGPATAPTLALGASARNLLVDGQTIGNAALRVDGGPSKPLAAALELRAAAQAVKGRSESGRPPAIVCEGSLAVRASLALASLAKGLPTAEQLRHTHFDVFSDLRGIPLRVLARLAGSSSVSGGAGALRVSAEGTPVSPKGAVNLQITGAAGPRFPPTDGRLDVSVGARDTRLALRVLRGQRELLSASGVLEVPSSKLRERKGLVSSALTFRLAAGPWRLLRSDVGGSAARGLPQTLSTRLVTALTVDGTLERPTVNLTASLADTRLGAEPLGNARAVVTYAAGRAHVDAQFHSGQGGELRLTGQSAIELGFSQVARGVDVAHAPIDLALTARSFDLSWLSGLSRDVRRVGGELTATITARGTAGAPEPRGRLAWTKGALSLTGLGDYHDVRLEAQGSEHSFWIDELRASSGEGTARVTASVSQTAAGPYDVQSTMTLRRFPFYGQGQPLANVSIDGHLTAIASSSSAKGTLDVSEAHVELTDAKQKDLQPLSRPSDVILMRDGSPASPAEAVKLAALAPELGRGHPSAASETVAPTKPVKPFTVEVAVDAPRNLWVRGRDMSVELGLSPNLRVVSASPTRIYGEILVRRGRIDVLGRRFDLQAGSTVDFSGPPDEPRLDVTAKYVNDSENVSVILTAKGPLDNLTIAVSSPERPDLTEGQLYTLIVTGRLQLGGNSAGSASASVQAASIVVGVVASQLQKTLAKRLPLDVLTIQAGEGLSGSRLEAGTYVTSKLYAGYVGRVGANPALLQNTNAVHLEYQLTRRWSLDAEYGNVGTGTADLIWTRHY